jgi:hypothetical protein
MSKTKSSSSSREISLGSTLSRSFGLEPAGTVVATTVDSSDVQLVKRYRECSTFTDLNTFVKSAVRDGISWMRRMINGSERFELRTMDYWTLDREASTLTLKNPGKSLRNHEVIFDIDFTKGSIEQFHTGMGLILSSTWYKSYCLPLALVELVASLDLLFAEAHAGMSAASASGVPRVNLSEEEV